MRIEHITKCLIRIKSIKYTPKYKQGVTYKIKYLYEEDIIF